MKTIIVPLDGSALAEQVLPYVRLLAGMLGADIRLLHVLTDDESTGMIAAGGVPRMTTVGMPATYPELWRRARELLREQAEIYLESQIVALRAEGFQAASEVRAGVPYRSIAECAEAAPEPLIVMATHGYGGLRRWAVGSVADKVIQAARVPVFLVRSRDGAPDGVPPFKRILVPLDGSELATAALELALELARGAGAELILLRAVERQPPYMTAQILRRNQATAELSALVSQLGSQAPVTPVVAADYSDAAEAIVEEAARRRADLIVMATHGYGGVQRWLLGSVADKVLQAAPAPLLLVRPRAEAAGERG
jgi:nucleotide-binding universal stress UspA family protein